MHFTPLTFLALFMTLTVLGRPSPADHDNSQKLLDLDKTKQNIAV
jgi:hypothetical protein